MSFVTTQPEALMAAAGKLQGIGSAMAAQNAAAATPTTGVVPAAADEVSTLQATLFAAYGNLYRQVSAQATAIHDMFVHTLGISAGSYGATEAANSTATGSSASGLGGLINLLNGSASGPYALAPAALSNSGILGVLQLGDFGSAASDLLQLGSSGFLAPGALTGVATTASGGVGAGTLAAASAPPAAASAVGAAPMLASVGQASSVGGLSVPPGWAAPAAAASGAVPTTLTGAGWTAAAPHTAPVATMPAAMPSVASAGRGGFGLGAPRYGVKPTVMPKPAVL